MPRSSTLPLILIVLLLSGCAETIYNRTIPAAAQAEQYVETDDLNKLPNKKILITSFGIEFDTHVFKHSRSKINQTTTYTNQTSDVDLSNEVMQSIVDDAYGKLVKDLAAAGYDVIPYESYRDTPAYQTLIKVIGKTDSPVKMTFRYEGNLSIENSDALVFAPTGMVWYAPAAGEASGRYATVTNLGAQITGALGRGFSGEEPHVVSEIKLAEALNATALKVYYVVSPVRSTGMKPGYTIIGGGQSRLAFRTPGASTMHFTFSKNPPPLEGNAFVRLKDDVRLDPSEKSYEAIE